MTRKSSTKVDWNLAKIIIKDYIFLTKEKGESTFPSSNPIFLMCSKSPKSSFCHPSAPIATISAPESITHNLQKEGKIDQKIAALCKKSQLFLMFPVIKLYLSIHIHRINIFFKNLKNVKCVIFKTLYNCGKPVRLSISSMIALLKVYLEFCIYDELKCVNILSPIFEPISGSRKSRENFQIPFQQCEKKRGFLCKHHQVSQNLTPVGMSKSTWEFIIC